MGSADSERIYDRIAKVYDIMEAPMDWFGGTDRRRRVLSRARGKVLEVGIGTGLNLSHYPPGVELVGIDISSKMLDLARDRSQQLGIPVTLEQADVTALPFRDRSFDTVTGTCVFCSVDSPIEGIRELRRVLKPGGRLLLVEHVRPRNALLGLLFDALSPLTRRLMGPYINRRTEEYVSKAGFSMQNVRRDGIWREIEAEPA